MVRQVRAWFKIRDFDFWQGRKDFNTGMNTAAKPGGKRPLSRQAHKCNKSSSYPLIVTTLVLFCLCRIILAAPKVPSQNILFSEQITAALQDSFRKTGSLEPWQMSLFQEEVLSQPHKFLKDLQTSGEKDKLRTEVDLEILRRYLRFYGPDHLKNASPKILVHLVTDKDCKKCQSSTLEIKNIITNRFKRRKIQTIFSTPQENKSLQPQDPDYLEKITNLTKGKNLSGSLTCWWRELQVDESDAAHQDESNFTLKLSLVLPEILTKTGQLEIQENEDFGTALTSLLTDYFTEIGFKLEEKRSLSAQNKSQQSKIILEVSGLKNYKKYLSLKNSLQTVLQNEYSLKEQKIKKGVITFLIFTENSVDSLLPRLAELKIESGHLVVLRTEANKIEMEAK